MKNSYKQAVFGKGRVRFTAKDTPTVFVLITWSKATNQYTLSVYFHERQHKAYTLFERSRWWDSQAMTKHIASLGTDVFTIEVVE